MTVPKRDHAADRKIDAAAQEDDGLARRREEQRHRRGGVEVQFLEREDVALQRGIDAEQGDQHGAGDEERRAVDEPRPPVAG